MDDPTIKTFDGKMTDLEIKKIIEKNTDYTNVCIKKNGEVWGQKYNTDDSVLMGNINHCTFSEYIHILQVFGGK